MTLKVKHSNSREEFESLLNDMIRYPERRSELSNDIHSVFGETKAVLVSDMSGFSRTTQRNGIICFLLMIHQMQKICTVSVEKFNGTVIKTDADNLFCLFDNIGNAISASQDILNRLDAVNMTLPEDQQLYVSFGLGYGSVLNIGNEDIFGDEVNLASKLGEDIANKGELLLTSAAKATIGDLKTSEHILSISGLALKYHKLENMQI